MREDEPKFGLNRDALEGSLEALAIGPEHGMLVEACRSLADVVDGPKLNVNAWREYRLAVQDLLKATAHSGSDAFQVWLDQMRASMDNSEVSE